LSKISLLRKTKENSSLFVAANPKANRSANKLEKKRRGIPFCLRSLLSVLQFFDCLILFQVVTIERMMGGKGRISGNQEGLFDFSSSRLQS
jgi:hypothetical protein